MCVLEIFHSTFGPPLASGDPELCCLMLRRPPLLRGKIEAKSSIGMEQKEPANTKEEGRLLSEGATEFLWAGLKGGLAFTVLGTIGSIRRGQIPLPMIAHTIFNFNR